MISPRLQFDSAPRSSFVPTYHVRTGPTLTTYLRGLLDAHLRSGFAESPEGRLLAFRSMNEELGKRGLKLTIRQFTQLWANPDNLMQP